MTEADILYARKANSRSKTVVQVHRLLAKVEEMKAQRATLMEQFRAEVHEDDITKKLVTEYLDCVSHI